MKTKNKILPEQEEEKTFQYRTYGKGELALLYLPNILQQSAAESVNLNGIDFNNNWVK